MTDTAKQFIRLGLSLLDELTDHDEPEGTTIEDTLIEIVQTANSAHKQHTGEFISPSLIQPEPLDD